MYMDEVYTLSRFTFDTYAGMRSPALPEGKAGLQVRLHRWETTEFGYQPPERMALGIGEEIGELAEARDVENVTLALDAIADACVYAMQLCGHARLDFWTLATAAEAELFHPLALSPVPASARAFNRAVASAGKLQHATLKWTQKIRGMADDERFRRAAADGIFGLAYHLIILCAFDYQRDFWETVLGVSEQVMKRTWKADPEKGGTAA